MSVYLVESNNILREEQAEQLTDEPLTAAGQKINPVTPFQGGRRKKTLDSSLNFRKQKILRFIMNW